VPDLRDEEKAGFPSDILCCPSEKRGRLDEIVETIDHAVEVD
jgi:hypothetical protein